MGFQKFKRPLDVRTASTLPDVKLDLAQFDGLQFTPSRMASATSAGATLSWGRFYGLATTSTGGSPTVMSLAASSSGDCIFICANSISSSSSPVKVKASTTGQTFDGTNDALSFSYNYQSAIVAAGTSGKLFLVAGSSALLSTST